MILAVSPDAFRADEDPAPGARHGALDDRIDAQRLREFGKRLAGNAGLASDRSVREMAQDTLHARQATE